ARVRVEDLLRPAADGVGRGAPVTVEVAAERVRLAEEALVLVQLVGDPLDALEAGDGAELELGRAALELLRGRAGLAELRDLLVDELLDPVEVGAGAPGHVDLEHRA